MTDRLFIRIITKKNIHIFFKFISSFKLVFILEQINPLLLKIILFCSLFSQNPLLILIIVLVNLSFWLYSKREIFISNFIRINNIEENKEEEKKDNDLGNYYFQVNTFISNIIITLSNITRFFIFNHNYIQKQMKKVDYNYLLLLILLYSISLIY